MPSTTYSTTTRFPSDDNGPPLTLKVAHCIDVVEPSDVPLGLKALPQSFIVTHDGNIEISLQGRYGSNIPLDTFSNSGGILELVAALTENKSILCVEDISEVYNDGERLQMSISPAGPSAETIVDDSLPQLKLTGLRIEFIWGIKGRNLTGTEGKRKIDPPGTWQCLQTALSTACSAEPFSSKTILLPYRKQWDLAIKRVLVNHMLRQGTPDKTFVVRYPYIFGRRKTGLASENNLYRNISNSLCQIYLRSPNREFKKTGKKLFQRLAEKSETHCDGSWDRLLNLQTPTGQAVFAQDEVHARRSLSREDDQEDGINTEERFKMLISRSLAALYIAAVRPGKKDFELKTLKAESSRSEQHERAVSDEDKEDDLEGDELMDILELDAPSTDTAMDEVKPDGFLTPVPETPPISFANKDDRRTTNSSPHPSDDFSPLDEDEQGDGTPNSDLETTHDDIFLDDEYHSHDTVEGSSSSDHGDYDLEFLDSPPHFSHSLPVPSNAEKPPDLLFDDSVGLPVWPDISQNGGFSQMDYDYDEANMLDLESPLMTPDDPPLPSLRGSGDEHPACLEEDLLLLSPASYPSSGSLDNFEIEML